MSFDCRPYRAIVILVSLGLLLVSVPGYTNSKADNVSEPGKIIKTYARQTFELLEKYTSTGDTQPPPKMKRVLSSKLITIVDYRLMTKMALGPQARSMSAEQLKDVRRIFCPLILNMYYQRMVERMFRENNPWIITGFDVLNSRITGNNNYAIVKTKVRGYKKEKGPENERSLPLDFKLINRGNGWKVYDITIMNVSLIENYKSQFSSILANNSVNGLVKKLSHKLDSLNTKKLTAPGSCSRIAEG